MPLKTLALAAAVWLSPLTAHAEPLKVIASFSIIGDFAKEVGRDRIQLTTLVGPGNDAHIYEPKPADVAKVADADVVLVNGLHFEGFLDRLIRTSKTESALAELTEGAETLHMGEGNGHDHATGHDGDIDPHAFQSVANAKIYVRNIADAFCAADAAGCDIYKANAVAYGARLEGLDAEIKAAVAAIPAGRRIIITSHDAFRYFAHAYGLTFLAPEGVSTDAEASAADVAKLVRQVRADKASAIFLENVTNPKLIEQIAAETGLTIGGTLYSDALSAGPPAATYIDLMRHNAQAIRGAANGS